MKNIVLTAVVLLLTMKFNFNKNIPFVVNSINTDTVVNKKAPTKNINNPGKPNGLNNKSKTKINNKSKHGLNKTKIAAKKNKKTTNKHFNKLNAANQINRNLHKKISAEGMSVEKGTVKFGFDKNTLANSKTFNQVMHIADKLIFDSTLQVSISGFTDNIGSTTYNDILSMKRAQLIKDYLVDLGVDEGQIHLSYSGMADPIADNNTPDGRAENRRVEFVLFAAG